MSPSLIKATKAVSPLEAPVAETWAGVGLGAGDGLSVVTSVGNASAGVRFAGTALGAGAGLQAARTSIAIRTRGKMAFGMVHSPGLYAETISLRQYLGSRVSLPLAVERGARRRTPTQLERRGPILAALLLHT